MFAAEHHFTAITFPRFERTALPMNIDDRELQDEGPATPRDRAVHTVRRHFACPVCLCKADVSTQDMSFFLARIGWIIPIRKMIEEVHDEGELEYRMVQK